MPKVFKYERMACESFFASIHGQNFQVNEIWIPETKVSANIVEQYSYDPNDDEYIANAFFSEKSTDASGVEIEISQDLYDRINHMAAIHKEYEDLRKTAGPQILEALRAAGHFQTGRCSECNAAPHSHKDGCSKICQECRSWVGEDQPHRETCSKAPKAPKAPKPPKRSLRPERLP